MYDYHMPKTAYVDFHDISELQTNIMRVVDKWVHEEKTPIPHKEIITTMKSQGIKTFTTISALNVLLIKGYLRRAHIISNKTFYVQLRTV